VRVSVLRSWASSRRTSDRTTHVTAALSSLGKCCRPICNFSSKHQFRLIRQHVATANRRSLADSLSATHAGASDRSSWILYRSSPQAAWTLDVVEWADLLCAADSSTQARDPRGSESQRSTPSRRCRGSSIARGRRRCASEEILLARRPVHLQRAVTLNGVVSPYLKTFTLDPDGLGAERSQDK
jgi:hypothetical protein